MGRKTSCKCRGSILVGEVADGCCVWELPLRCRSLQACCEFDRPYSQYVVQSILCLMKITCQLHVLLFIWGVPKMGHP